MAYNTIGPYQSGVWLVVSPDGKNAFVADRGHLPQEGGGTQFYWLGNTVSQAEPRLETDAGKLGLFLNINQDFSPQVKQALSGKPAAIQQDQLTWEKWVAGLGTIFGAGALLGIITDTGVAAGAAAGGVDAATAGGTAAGAANIAKAVTGGLTVGALFSNPSLWAGVAMALLGAVLVLFGIVKLSGADPKQLAKKVI